MPRIDNIVDAVHDRFSNRFYVGESEFFAVKSSSFDSPTHTDYNCLVSIFISAEVFVDVQGVKSVLPSNPPPLPFTYPARPLLQCGSGVRDRRPMILTFHVIFPLFHVHRYYARIARIFPPRRPSPSPSPSSTNSLTPPPQEIPPAHSLVSDLMISQDDADKIDDPRAYYYSVQLVESNGGEDERCSDSFMEVTEFALRSVVSFRV